MLKKQLNNLKPQLKVPFFHRNLIRYDLWNKGKLSHIHFVNKMRLIFSSNQDSVKLSLATYLCNYICRKYIGHMRKHSKLLCKMQFRIKLTVSSFKGTVIQII